MGFEMTMFERLHRMNVTFTLLDEQYRMHPTIGDLVSKLCYDGKVRNGTSLGELYIF